MATTKPSTSDAVTVKKNELFITRIFNAPRTSVWRAWTDPEWMMRWWGPKTYTAPACKMDFRVGGSYLYCMRSPEGKDFWDGGVYREIVQLERIVYTDSFVDEKGNVVPATYYGLDPAFPLEMTVSVTFADAGPGKTRLTLLHAGMPAGKQSKLAGLGWNESFDKLAASLVNRTLLVAEPGKLEIIVTRTFDAPRERVFKIFTDPNLIPQWWGPRYLTTTVEKMEVRPGGMWRFVQRDPAGSVHAFHGVYHEVSAPGRIVQTFEYEGAPGHVLLETDTLEEQDGKTRLTTQSVFQSVADRDEMLSSGMEGGQDESYERITELLAR